MSSSLNKKVVKYKRDILETLNKFKIDINSSYNNHNYTVDYTPEGLIKNSELKKEIDKIYYNMNENFIDYYSQLKVSEFIYKQQNRGKILKFFNEEGTKTALRELKSNNNDVVFNYHTFDLTDVESFNTSWQAAPLDTGDIGFFTVTATMQRYVSSYDEKVPLDKPLEHTYKRDELFKMFVELYKSTSYDSFRMLVDGTSDGQNGGKKSSYKSTGQKVTVVIKKKSLTRTIYKNSKNIGYIKVNNEYKLLSKFKILK
jgi:hypothetical protein